MHETTLETENSVNYDESSNSKLTRNVRWRTSTLETNNDLLAGYSPFNKRDERRGAIIRNGREN